MHIHVYTSSCWNVFVCSRYRHVCTCYRHVCTYMSVHGTDMYVPFCQILSRWSGFQMRACCQCACRPHAPDNPGGGEGGGRFPQLRSDYDSEGGLGCFAASAGNARAHGPAREPPPGLRTAIRVWSGSAPVRRTATDGPRRAGRAQQIDWSRGWLVTANLCPQHHHTQRRGGRSWEGE